MEVHLADGICLADIDMPGFGSDEAPQAAATGFVVL